MMMNMTPQKEDKVEEFELEFKQPREGGSTEEILQEEKVEKPKEEKKEEIRKHIYN